MSMAVMTVTLGEDGVTASCNRCTERVGFDLHGPYQADVILEAVLAIEEHWLDEHEE